MTDAKKLDTGQKIWDSSAVDCYQAFFEEAADGMFITDQHWRFLAANRQWLALSGYALADLLGIDWTTIIDPQDLSRQPPVTVILQQDRIVTREQCFLHKDGSRIHVDISQRVLADGNVLCVVRDITERKQLAAEADKRTRELAALQALELAERKSAEERLQLETVFSQTALDSLPGLFYLFDHEGRFLRWNTNFEMVSGYSVQELAAMSPEDFFLGKDKKTIRAAVMEVFQDGTSTAEADFLAKDRTTTPCFFTGRRFFLGDKPCLTGMGIDITERKNAEAALQDSEKKSRAIFERSPVGIILLDSQSTVLDCNEHFAGIFGVARERYLGIRLLDRLPDGPMRDHLLVTMAGEGIHRFEDSHTSIFSGKQVYLSIISEKINPDLFIVVITDITEQKQAATDQDKLQEQLLQAQKMESVGRLAGGVAHDFNNMLTAILGHAELAMLNCSPDDSIHVDLKVIESAARRSADLVRQLLAFARKQTVAPRIIDLNDCVTGLLKMLVRLIGEDIDLVWKPAGDVWSIKVDPSQIDQILANLCVNARDAIEGVGKITIGTKNTLIDAEYCTLHPTISPGEYVQLSVSDNGYGMDKEVIEHIFEPFFTTKEVGKGTGLGLSTVYGIAKQNQGFVNVYSEPGEGTTFKIYLPRIAVSAVETKVEKKSEIPRGHDQLVLLVEDEEVILKIGQAMLTRLGYRVLTAAAPSEALRQAQAHAEEIELLITDVIMPEMNGRDLANILIGVIPGLKCLFTSGYTADIIAHHGVLDEKINFIQKPFSFLELAVKVCEAMDQSDD